ncbi:hypothetical protein D9611_007562 [Ephemerocybe angulata]|uniref:Uncharacterized protein n=1 Tax=Ephemerocybe angulata TaxID=980116 RepID=A0A8H5BYL0_9AGAR|nr:hypothetical protein D9611_007562 [Tulosesus angulatus]
METFLGYEAVCVSFHERWIVEVRADGVLDGGGNIIWSPEVYSRTGMQFARQYPDKQVSTSSQDTIALETRVRLFSWFVAMQMEETVAAGSKTILRAGLDLDDDEVVQSLGELKVRFVEEQDLMDF